VNHFLSFLKSMSRTIMKTIHELYESVQGDQEDFMNEDTFSNNVEELVDIGMIRTGVVNDFTVYYARQGLLWTEFVHLVDPVKKSILLLLVENPKTFFVLQNTQKGKMRIASLEIKQWARDEKHKVVAFIVVDNDKTLAEQSVDGIVKTFGEHPVKIFALSSNSKTSFEEVKTYIDAYAHDTCGDYPMPIIALLSNLKQCEKMLKLIQHIHQKAIQYQSLLRYGMIWDEADKTYTQLRMKPFTIDGQSMTCQTFTVEKTEALYRLGFVTATDGVLLDEDYPECANAYLYPVDISEEDQLYYRALHHEEAVTHHIKYTSKHTNNTYALEVFEQNALHFRVPLTLSSGELYFRKIIVNSNGSTEDMRQFATKCSSMGMYALVFNGQGSASVKVYRDGKVESHKTKGKRLNELLFYIYKKLSLHDKPIVIIGRRKVDRGLGFHYCPRDDNEITIDGSLGKLTTRREGLVWTDMILGKIEDKDSAVQKAGRLAGIIGNSPQYPGEIHFWTDEETEQRIRRHNLLVDHSNRTQGCSALQAKKQAEYLNPVIRKNHTTDPKLFRVFDSEELMRRALSILGRTTHIAEKNHDGFIEASLNKKSDVLDILDVIRQVPTIIKNGGSNNGTSQSRSAVACYKDTNDNSTLMFVVLVPPTIPEDKVQKMDHTYKDEFITIPQTGPY